jgi:hypothetical protein
MRQRFERVLRSLAIVAVVAALGIATWEAVRGDAGDAPLRWTLEGSPSPVMRDSLAALQRAGYEVEWIGAVAPLMAMAEPVREPGDRWRVAVVNAAPVEVRDSLGVIDSLDVPGAITTEAVRGAVRVVAGGTEARVAPSDSITLGRIVVFGRAGWEPRFTIAALEEAGWQVDARLTLGRDRDVVQGEFVPRRARHAAAIVFDTASLVREGPLFARFVREGGGLILAGEAAAADVPALRSLTGAQVVRLEPPETRSFAGHEPTHALPLRVLGSRRADAVLVESREGLPAIVARRVGAGRIVQMGYGDTWRWRMEGEGRAVEEHRTFWSRTVGLAVSAKSHPRNAMIDGVPAPRDAARDDPAPRAELFHALGAPTDAVGTASSPPRALPRWIGLLILAMFVIEWASRRGRGAA